MAIVILSCGLFFFSVLYIALFRGVLPGLFRHGPENGSIQIINNFILLLIGLHIFFLALLYAFFVRHILDPVERVSREMYRITADGRLPAGGYSGREFGALRASVNDLLDKQKLSCMSADVFRGIFNGMEAFLFVSDLETDEILFMNEPMKRDFGLDGPVTGRPCWKLLYPGSTGRCSFCPIPKLLANPQKPVIWERLNPLDGKYFKNTDSIIKWIDGRDVHLQYSVDISDIKTAEKELKRRLEQQELMSAISQNFISTDDTEALINHALEMTGLFMNTSRVLLSKINAEDSSLTFVYE
jgi:PAS domain-containing protein